MRKHRSLAAFHSCLAPLLEPCVQEKRACGYPYHEPPRVLRHLDHCVAAAGRPAPALPRALPQQWLSQQAHERARTHPQRITSGRPFATFLRRLGSPAYVPDAPLTTRGHAPFAPRMLTPPERRPLLQAVDPLVPTARAPLRPRVMPAIFRQLYGWGFRLGEVWHLRVREVDLEQGSLTVRQGKLRKDRLVPPAPSLGKR
jgi:integrase